MGRTIDPAQAAIYRGAVVHTRVRPRHHHLRYSVFALLADIDKLHDTARALRFFSLDRFNLFSIFTKDFQGLAGEATGGALRDLLRREGVDPDGLKVRMLAYPRVLGFTFNPITTYFVTDADGAMRAIVYEVHNTFGEHHFYLIAFDTPVPDGQTLPPHSARKAFYVSPFNTMAGHYRFTVRPPADKVTLGILYGDEAGPLLSAAFSGKRREMSDSELVKLALAYPFMTVKVILGIHWEALKLWAKGVKPTLHLRDRMLAALKQGRPAE